MGAATLETTSIHEHGRLLVAARQAQQLLAVGDCDPGPVLFAACAQLVGVDGGPALDPHRVRHPACHQSIEGPAATVGGASRPARASSIRLATVSAASYLFVPITPVGPRLIHPVT